MPIDKSRVELAEAIARIMPAIRAYSYAILRELHQAEDVVKEVIVLVIARWDALPRGEAFLAWVREATLRKALELRRKLRKSRSRNDRVAAKDLSEKALKALANSISPPGLDASVVLKDCVDRLPSNARAVLVKRYGENLFCNETASRLIRSKPGLHTILKRARLALPASVDRHIAALSLEETPYEQELLNKLKARGHVDNYTQYINKMIDETWRRIPFDNPAGFDSDAFSSLTRNVKKKKNVDEKHISSSNIKSRTTHKPTYPHDKERYDGESSILLDQYKNDYEIENEAYWKMMPYLLSEYNDMYVAIYKGILIDADKNMQNLFDRTRSKYHEQFVLIRHVTKDAETIDTLDTPEDVH